MKDACARMGTAWDIREAALVYVTPKRNSLLNMQGWVRCSLPDFSSKGTVHYFLRLRGI
jgi:hypothetical protein